MTFFSFFFSPSPALFCPLSGNVTLCKRGLRPTGSKPLAVTKRSPPFHVGSILFTNLSSIFLFRSDNVKSPCGARLKRWHMWTFYPHRCTVLILVRLCGDVIFRAGCKNVFNVMYIVMIALGFVWQLHKDCLRPDTIRTGSGLVQYCVNHCPMAKVQ